MSAELLALRQAVQRLRESNLALIDQVAELLRQDMAKQAAINHLLRPKCDYCDQPAAIETKGVRYCTEHLVLLSLTITPYNPGENEHE